MSGSRIAAITTESGLKRSIQRLTSATGEETAVVADASGISTAEPPALILYDVRTLTNLAGLMKSLPATSKVMFLTTEDTLMATVALLADPRVVSVLAINDTFDSGTGFTTAAAKILRGDVYGIEKYFGWSVHTESFFVKTYEEKSAAIERLKEFARVGGYRGPVRERILAVTDELLMNALYHAPVDKSGKPLYKDVPRAEMSRVPLAAPVTVQYASDGKTLAIGVRDRFGSVTRDVLVTYLARAAAGQSQIEQKTSGAGLGLAMVLRSASRLVFNLASQNSLEVIALFDMEAVTRHAAAIHVFAPRLQQPQPASRMIDLGSVEEIELPRGDGGGRAGVVILTILLTIAAVVGAAFAARDWVVDEVAPLAVGRKISLSTDPAGTHVWLDGRDTGKVTPTTLDIARGSKRLNLRHTGYHDLELDVQMIAGEAAVRTTLKACTTP